MTDDDFIDELIQSVQNIYIKSAMPGTTENDILKEHETIAKKRFVVKSQMNYLRECIGCTERELERFKKRIKEFRKWVASDGLDGKADRLPPQTVLDRMDELGLGE